PVIPGGERAGRGPELGRETVAVLAVDLVFPEDVYEPWTLARRWETRIGEQVAGFGGVFIARSPSRLTAVFGVPRALEQLAERAVQAALTIQRHLGEGDGGIRPELRMAVHLGAVHFDVHARDLATGCLAVGDTFVLPGRLLGHAAAGELLVSAAT